MNKGRNIALLLGCMLSISILTFLVKLNSGNREGVVDRVRYVKGDTIDDITDYSFYFVDRDELTAKLEYKGDNVWYLSFNDYEYNYTIEGTDRENAVITPEARFEDIAKETEPFEIISKRVFLYMVFGKPPIVSVPQAILVFLIGISGGVVIITSEELWYIVGRHNKEEIPKWQDLTIYKRVGGTIIGLAILLLIIFIFI